MSRILIIAEAANPEWVSVPLVGWSLAMAIAERTSVHLVTQVRNREAILRAGLTEGVNFTAIDSERLAAPLNKLANAMRGGQGVGWTTLAAIAPLSYYYFEWLVLKRFGPAIRRGEFAVVHRITPLSPTIPSILAKFCAKASIPFVLGPLNGGVPWPPGFAVARRKEREWLSSVRSAYKLMPGYRSTLGCSAAILVGSKSTLSQVPTRFFDKTIYLPENAIDPKKFSSAEMVSVSSPLHACFVGRLVPYKGPDMLLEAVASLVQAGRLTLDIIGDGPMMSTISSIVSGNGLEAGVTLRGWLSHEELKPIMQKSQLLLFPSIREFGGGVVLEAMAMGIVPVVVDYGGPGELVTDDVGWKIPCGPRRSIVDNLRKKVIQICDSPAQLIEKSNVCRARVLALHTWSARADQILDVYQWVGNSGSVKPRFFQ